MFFYGVQCVGMCVENERTSVDTEAPYALKQTTTQGVNETSNERDVKGGFLKCCILLVTSSMVNTSRDQSSDEPRRRSCVVIVLPYLR